VLDNGVIIGTMVVNWVNGFAEYFADAKYSDFIENLKAPGLLRFTERVG
jgi:hypothetical protein